MKLKSLAAFVAGFVACVGITTGGIAVAQSGTFPAPKGQITVKFEWVNVDSTGKKTTDSMVVVADSEREASSSEEFVIDGTRTVQQCSVTAYPTTTGAVTLKLQYDVMKNGQAGNGTMVKTMITIPNGETRVIKSVARKTATENSESLLFVTPTM